MCIAVGIATAGILLCAAVLYAYFPRKYNASVRKYAAEFNVPADLIRAVVHTESKFRPRATSRSGAVGLMQLMPSTAAWMAERLGEPQLADRLTDADANLRLGTAYLRYLLDKYPLADALAAYNAGEGNLLRWKSEGKTKYGYKETRTYVKRVRRARKMYGMLYR